MILSCESAYFIVLHTGKLAHQQAEWSDIPLSHIILTNVQMLDIYTDINKTNLQFGKLHASTNNRCVTYLKNTRKKNIWLFIDKL